MFDVYMHAHAIDPQARQRMVALFGVATLVTAVSLGSAMVGERLGIAKVGPPTIEGILVLPIEMVLPPPPEPPPRPVDPIETQVAATVATTPDPKPHVERTELAPIDEQPSATDSPATRIGPDVIGNTSLGNVATPGGMGCVVQGTCSTARPKPPSPPEPPPRTFESIDVARERALASPDPPTDQLARTPAGLARRSASSKVSFCIAADGKTTDVRTRKSSGDQEVDRICRDTVARRWRFQPFAVDGRARTTCSEVTFQIAFE